MYYHHQKNGNFFPKGRNSIFIEYNRNILECFFLENYYIWDCFKEVEYLENPLVFDSYSNYDIIWEKTKDGVIYKSMKEISVNKRLMDQLFVKMFTRINKRFEKQHELRCILGGSNLPNKDPNLSGYKIIIPKNAINAIYINSKTPTNIKSKLNELNIELKEIE